MQWNITSSPVLGAAQPCAYGDRSDDGNTAQVKDDGLTGLRMRIATDAEPLPNMHVKPQDRQTVKTASAVPGRRHHQVAKEHSSL